MVMNAISDKYPSHKYSQDNYADCWFIGEETYSSGQQSILDDSPTWIVDPIDGRHTFIRLIAGTTNFVHGIPYVAISIGFTISRRPTIGVVLNPFTAQLYSGIHTKGSTLTILSPDLSRTISTQSLPLYPPQPLDLRSSAIAIEFGSDRSGPNFDTKLSTFRNLTSSDGGMVHALRSYGSAALNLCSVASGFIDAYWEGGCWEWDVCAGWVILSEAGGCIVDGNPREGPNDIGRAMESPDLCGRIYLAVRRGRVPEETERWVREFWSLMGGRMEYGR
jgi:myo-inositol-1(or 4)-monophosphatase